MGTINDIEEAVSKLSPTDLAAFRLWFAGFDSALWDRQFEADAKSGELDALANEALDDLQNGRCTDL